MKIKATATRPGSTGIRSSAAVRAAATAIAAVLAVHVMFAARLVAAQHTAAAFKAGRAPRVYNALITSDQRLLPSQADPIVTPVLRPFPFFYGGWPEVYAVPVPPATARLGQQHVPQPDDGFAADHVPDVASAPEAAGDDGGPPPAAVIKNNKPAGTAVLDVPPPPLPVSRGRAAAGEKKAREEFPPAPVGFAI